MLVYAMLSALSPARAVIERAVEDGVVPGAVAIAGTDTERWIVSVGGARRLGGEPVTPDTRYDLASLTKVVSTLPAILKLVADGEVRFSDTVQRFFANAGWIQMPSVANATIAQLLTHTSGLPAWKPLFALTNDRHTAIANVLQTPLKYPSGHLMYSDLGMILLGAIIERVSTQRQDVFVRTSVFEPLQMLNTDYGPLVGVPVAATEDCGWRGVLLEGVVHDENAYIMEGVAGHAGLFGTAEDLAIYSQAWLSLAGELGPDALLLAAVKEHARDNKERRALGWKLAGDQSVVGRYASLNAYGHEGFTGTSLWLDPDQGWFAALLTNRVHPDRSRGKGIDTLRRDYYEVVTKALAK
ncbi:MAG: beta-lactamase family protein [Trueperaceae bacterium]|nr:MAG: beta-lactamase family protein [Trueperaceae bacterium]